MKLSYYSKFEVIIKSLNNYRLIDAQPAFVKHFGNIFPTIKRTSDSITFTANENDDIIGFNKKDISKQLINRLNELKEQYKNSESLNDQSFYQLLEGFDEKWFHPDNIIEGSNQNFKIKYWGIPPKDLKKAEYKKKSKKPPVIEDPPIIAEPIIEETDNEESIKQEPDDEKPKEEAIQEEDHDEPEWDDIHTIDEEETSEEELMANESLENHHSLIVEVANGDAIFDLTYDDGSTEQIETHELRKSLPKEHPVKIKISKQGYTTRYMHFSALKDKESLINLSEDPYTSKYSNKKSGCLSFIGKTIMYIAIIAFIYIQFIDNRFNPRKARKAYTKKQCENDANGLWVYEECLNPNLKSSLPPINITNANLKNGRLRVDYDDSDRRKILDNAWTQFKLKITILYMDGIEQNHHKKISNNINKYFDIEIDRNTSVHSYTIHYKSQLIYTKYGGNTFYKDK